MAVRYHIENDFLDSDWAVINDAVAFVKGRCEAIADANVDSSGIGNCPAFEGMQRDEIVKMLFEEHLQTIEVRDGPLLNIPFINPDKNGTIDRAELDLSLGDRVKQARTRQADVIADAIEVAIRNMADLQGSQFKVEGHLRQVESPDVNDGVDYAYEGLRLRFSTEQYSPRYTQVENHDWDLSMRIDHTFNDIETIATNTTEGLREDLFACRQFWNDSLVPSVAATDVCAGIETLPRFRAEALKKRGSWR